MNILKSRHREKILIDYLSIGSDLTVQDTLNYIRRHGHEADTIHFLDVVDQDAMAPREPATRIMGKYDQLVLGWGALTLWKDEMKDRIRFV